LQFLRKDEVTFTDADENKENKKISHITEQIQNDQKSNDINCLMRLTDDYLLMTTSKTNAIQFVEKLYRLSQVSNFKFNRKKLKTNFKLDLERIGCPRNEKQNIDTKMCDWIGISIDMDTLQLIPNINTKKEA
jgi:hypothetical protein